MAQALKDDTRPTVSELAQMFADDMLGRVPMPSFGELADGRVWRRLTWNAHNTDFDVEAVNIDELYTLPEGEA